jgi:hypothetical protein
MQEFVSIKHDKSPVSHLGYSGLCALACSFFSNSSIVFTQPGGGAGCIVEAQWGGPRDYNGSFALLSCGQALCRCIGEVCLHLDYDKVKTYLDLTLSQLYYSSPAKNMNVSSPPPYALFLNMTISFRPFLYIFTLALH